MFCVADSSSLYPFRELCAITKNFFFCATDTLSLLENHCDWLMFPKKILYLPKGNSLHMMHLPPIVAIGNGLHTSAIPPVCGNGLHRRISDIVWFLFPLLFVRRRNLFTSCNTILYSY